MAVASGASIDLPHARYALIRAQLELRSRRLSLLLRRFNPSQPRVPAGSRDGGQWTSEGGGGAVSSDDATLVPVGSRNEERSPLKIDLLEEEARGGHAIREHVGRTDAELIGRLEREYARLQFFGLTLAETGRRRVGSFPSLSEANEWANKAIEANRGIVDEVASGRMTNAFITHRFGFVTGREAIVTPIERSIRVRRTYGIGVVIDHDRRTPRGFSVRTAYPRNEDQSED